MVRITFKMSPSRRTAVDVLEDEGKRVSPL